MTKAEFNAALRRKLDGISEADRKSILDYYDECINDRMDDGASEEEAVAALGSVDELAAAVLADTPVTGLIPHVTERRTNNSGFAPERAQVIEQDFFNVDVELTACDVRFVRSEDGICHVAFDGSKRFGLPVVTVRGNRLIVRNEARSIKWIDRITGWLEDSGERLVIVFLPAREYGDLRVQLDSGDCELTPDLQFMTADLRSKSGDVICAGRIRDTLRIETMSGDVKLERFACEGELILKSNSGDVEAKAIRCGSIRVNTISGDLDIEELISAQAELHTISGDLDAESAAVTGYLRAQTVSGDLDLGCRDAGSVNLITVSGDINARFAQQMQFTASTVSGDVRIPTSNPYGKPCAIKTVSGDITVRA